MYDESDYVTKPTNESDYVTKPTYGPFIKFDVLKIPRTSTAIQNFYLLTLPTLKMGLYPKRQK